MTVGYHAFSSSGLRYVLLNRGVSVLRDGAFNGCTQLRGVSADIRLPSFWEAYADLGEDKLPGALKWSHISPAAYRAVDNLDGVLPELRARSEARRDADPRWQARMKLLEGPRARTNRPT